MSLDIFIVSITAKLAVGLNMQLDNRYRHGSFYIYIELVGGR